MSTLPGMGHLQTVAVSQSSLLWSSSSLRPFLLEPSLLLSAAACVVWPEWGAVEGELAGGLRHFLFI